MTKFYWLQEPKAWRGTGDLSRARHKWGGLPGLQCPECGATWAGSATAYPSVDLSSLPQRTAFEEARPEPFDEFVRLRELVRPLVPPGAQLLPGAEFGPLVGTATGTFSPIFFYFVQMPVMHREALEKLQAEGVRGLKGFPTELRFRQKNHPELVELEILPHGRLHIDCLPPDRPPRCLKCGRNGFKRPDDLILDAASLPENLDLFRLTDFEATFICTERFVDAVRRLELHEAVFRELPLR
ncbi:double-CXXCG motif protein [Archangium violaceum]|uniref:SitI6 family double-CXXCG motif immunity protein n=1 Tax=Archangium violaceum TaxID=83451 RepID=UPI00194FEFB4|nr:double-CXXCG motif protein [Archangium violaceum]QRN97229.1 double-CXXCG motif protein [Archangium violaceum]